MNIWTLLWLWWGFTFVAIEVPAFFFGRPGATLSEHIWNWFHVRDPRPTGKVWFYRALLLALLILLTVHLAFGVPTL